MLPMPNIASGAIGCPRPSAPAAPVQVPASLTTAALRPGEAVDEFGNLPFSSTTASTRERPAPATAESRGASDGAGNDRPASACADGVADGDPAAEPEDEPPVQPVSATTVATRQATSVGVPRRSAMPPVCARSIKQRKAPSVNRQIEVPAGGQLKVPDPRG